MVGVRLGKELEAQLEKLSKIIKRPKSVMIRQAIVEKFEDWEDLAAIVDSLENLGRTYSLAEIEAEVNARTRDLER